jgi:uncharacterized protein (TIGR03086 family)
MAETEGRDPTAARVASLIDLGRDREAAALGASARRDPDHASPDHRPAATAGGAMEVLDQLDQLGPNLGAVVGGIRPDQLDNPTPCDNFTVRGVLEHMVGGATMFTAAFRGEAPSDPPSGDALENFGPALGDLVEAMHAPGALDRTIQAPFGETPGEAFARFVVLDGLVHGWDMATATGQAYNPPDEVVADADAFARATLDPLRDGDSFGAATEPPADATPIERLAAYTGRHVTGGAR